MGMTLVFRIEAPTPCLDMIGRIYKVNALEYEDRGWCQFERMVSAMKDSSSSSQNLIRWSETNADIIADAQLGTEGTIVPRTPSSFGKLLQSLHFANGNDRRVVVKLYTKVFRMRASAATKLR